MAERGKELLTREVKTVARNAWDGLLDPTILILITLIGEQCCSLTVSFEDLQQFIKTSEYHFVLMKVSFEELQQFFTLCLNSTKDSPSFHFAPGKYICFRQAFLLQVSIFSLALLRLNFHHLFAATSIKL